MIAAASQSVPPSPAGPTRRRYNWHVCERALSARLAQWVRSDDLRRHRHWIGFGGQRFPGPGTPGPGLCSRREVFASKPCTRHILASSSIDQRGQLQITLTIRCTRPSPFSTTSSSPPPLSVLSSESPSLPMLAERLEAFGICRHRKARYLNKQQAFYPTYL